MTMTRYENIGHFRGNVMNQSLYECQLAVIVHAWRIVPL